MRSIALLVALPLLLFCDEPSAFEKQSGATKNDIKTLQNILTRLQQKVDTIGQAQEGISSLHESQSKKLSEQIIQNAQQAKDIEELRAQTDLLKSLQKDTQANAKEIEKLKAQLKELNTALSTLNQTILNELQILTQGSVQNGADSKAASQAPDSKAKGADSTAPNVAPGAATAALSESAKAPQAKDGDKASKLEFSKDTNKKAEIYAKAQEMFYSKDRESAKVRFAWLLEIGYKKAQCHFYLGEIAFAKGEHNDAIHHYKQSAITNDKAQYMPTLLLHTAQSFNAIKDTKNYNKFLDSLIANYPTSKEAQKAKQLKTQNKDKK